MRYLVGAVDLGPVLQQEMDDLPVAAPGRPDDGVHAVLWDRGHDGGSLPSGNQGLPVYIISPVPARDIYHPANTSLIKPIHNR